VALALILIVSRVKFAIQRRPKPVLLNFSGISRSLMVWFAFAIAVVFIEPLGFVVCFGLFTFFLITVIFRKPLWTALLVSVLARASFHLLFAVGLRVPLPTGIMGILTWTF
jgi:hypothetical protein